MAVWDKEDMLLFYFFDGSPSNGFPAKWLQFPSFAQLPTGCPPTQTECGGVVNPPVRLNLPEGCGAPEYEQGDTSYFFVDKQFCPITGKVLLGTSILHTSMECVDLPSTQVNIAILNNLTLSQPVCVDIYDCASGEKCDPISHTCVK